MNSVVTRSICRTVVAIALVLQVGCGGASPESDAKRMAALVCKAKRLAERAVRGDKSVVQESERLTKQAAALGEQLRGKYTSATQLNRFTKALEKEMNACQ